jgi:hypothetical protein
MQTVPEDQLETQVLCQWYIGARRCSGPQPFKSTQCEEGWLSVLPYGVGQVANFTGLGVKSLDKST